MPSPEPRGRLDIRTQASREMFGTGTPTAEHVANALIQFARMKEGLSANIVVRRERGLDVKLAEGKLRNIDLRHEQLRGQVVENADPDSLRTMLGMGADELQDAQRYLDDQN